METSVLEGLTLLKEQVQVLKLLSEGREVFVWFPTGYGKSLCYQLLPFLMDYKLGMTMQRSPCPSKSRTEVSIVESQVAS